MAQLMEFKLVHKGVSDTHNHFVYCLNEQCLQPIILEKIPKIKAVEETGMFPNRNKQKHKFSHDVGDKVKAQEYHTGSSGCCK